MILTSKNLAASHPREEAATPKQSNGGPVLPAATSSPESDCHAWLMFPELCSDHGRYVLRDFFERWKKDFQAKYPQLPDSLYNQKTPEKTGVQPPQSCYGGPAFQKLRQFAWCIRC